jgi:hypothetical protein
MKMKIKIIIIKNILKSVQSVNNKKYLENNV